MHIVEVSQFEENSPPATPERDILGPLTLKPLTDEIATIRTARTKTMEHFILKGVCCQCNVAVDAPFDKTRSFVNRRVTCLFVLKHYRIWRSKTVVLNSAKIVTSASDKKELDHLRVPLTRKKTAEKTGAVIVSFVVRLIERSCAAQLAVAFVVLLSLPFKHLAVMLRFAVLLFAAAASTSAFVTNPIIERRSAAPQSALCFGIPTFQPKGDKDDEEKKIGMSGFVQLLTAGMGSPFLGEYEGTDEETGKMMFSLEANNLVDENGNSKQTQMPYFESGWVDEEEEQKRKENGFKFPWQK